MNAPVEGVPNAETPGVKDVVMKTESAAGGTKRSLEEETEGVTQKKARVGVFIFSFSTF